MDGTTTGHGQAWQQQTTGTVLPLFPSALIKANLFWSAENFSLHKKKTVGCAVSVWRQLLFFIYHLHQAWRRRARPVICSDDVMSSLSRQHYRQHKCESKMIQADATCSLQFHCLWKQKRELHLINQISSMILVACRSRWWLTKSTRQGKGNAKIWRDIRANKNRSLFFFRKQQESFVRGKVQVCLVWQ